ncbi:recombination protein NinB [Castellaniella ginsengisoli]|uniref:Recombination protein NinB n=1 Tax=Castellaniella ginsengisoli TaxID=546114 RepID=A0AB39D1Q0_9BURK
MTGTLILTPATRPIARRHLDAAPDGYVFETPKEPKKRRIQEERYHAMLGDIAKQVEFFGQKRDLETVKRLLVDAFARVMADDGNPLQGWGTVLPSLDGSGVVQLGIQTRRFTIRQASEFIEYLFAWGAENNVIWSERVDVPGWLREKETA